MDNEKKLLEIIDLYTFFDTKRGTVKAVGHGTKDEEMVLKEGDVVLYGKYAGTELEIEGEKYLIMRQSDVLAIVG